MSNPALRALCIVFVGTLAAAGGCTPKEEKQVDYETALAKALEQRDATFCDEISVPRIIQDYGESPARAAKQCQLAVAVALDSFEFCETVDTPERPGCIERFAKARLKPEMCALIKDEYFVSKNTRDHAPLLRDRCRSTSISRPPQCLEGIESRHWREGMQERCFYYVAVNTDDVSWCEKAPEGRREACKAEFKMTKQPAPSGPVPY